MAILWSHRALNRLSEDLHELNERMHALETANKRLGLEWEELYDKVRHQMSRMARRAAVDAPLNDEVSENADALVSAAGVDPISAKILARRGIGRQAE